MFSAIVVMTMLGGWEPPSINPETVREDRQTFHAEFINRLPEKLKPSSPREWDCFWAEYLMGAMLHSAKLLQAKNAAAWEANPLKPVMASVYYDAKTFHEKSCGGPDDPNSPTGKYRTAMEWHLKQWGDIGQARVAQAVHEVQEARRLTFTESMERAGHCDPAGMGFCTPRGVRPTGGDVALAVVATGAVVLIIAAAPIDWPFLAAATAPAALQLAAGH